MSYLKIVRSARPDQEPLDPTAKAPNDAERAKALHRLEILGSPSEEIFSTITELAALTFHTPIALMSFVDADHVFYKQAAGVDKTGLLVDRKKSPCSLAILNSEVTTFRYELADPCVIADKEKLSGAGYKFYAGAPMFTSDGYAIGILAVVDRVYRVYSKEEEQILKDLAKLTMAEVEFRLQVKKGKAVLDLNARLKALHEKVELFRQ